MNRSFRVLLVVGCVACLEKDPPARQAAKPSEKKSSVVTLPVPYGKKLPCAGLLDAEKFSAALGKGVTIDDNTKSDPDATSVCQIKLSGVAPSAKDQLKMWNKNNRVLGVLPGDEMCQVTLYCSFLYDVAEQKKKCEAEGQTVSTDIGSLTCTKALEAGENYRTIVSVLDPDTHCKVQVNPGPSVTEEALVKQCARAASDLIGPQSLL